jgi:hypothetical protein
LSGTDIAELGAVDASDWPERASGRAPASAS